MQSIQAVSGNVRDMSSFLDGSCHRSPDRSPERALPWPSNPTSSVRDFARENGDSSPEKTPTRANTPVPYIKDSGRATPTLRPSVRQPPKSILGENTPPPSATMLALQTMPTPLDYEIPMSKSSDLSGPSRSPRTLDALSSQLLSLTSIATNLQREMAQLSKRSKDNATDLISLKEATNARDEDIRLSLRELVKNLSSGLGGHLGNSGKEGFLLDNKPHDSTPQNRAGKQFPLPRVSSPNTLSAALERELANSPSPYALDGAACLALLEKILREMGTKDGQERILSSISQMLEKSTKEDKDTPKRLEELMSLVKDSFGTRAIVKRRTQGHDGGDANDGNVEEDERRNFEVEYEPISGPLVPASRDLTQTQNMGKSAGEKQSQAYSKAAELASEEVQKLLKKLTHSVTENGGLTAEVKALVRELRGEVLGMGREMGRKLDEMHSGSGEGQRHEGADPEQVARIIQDGLAELKEHMESVMKERRRQSSSSSISRNTVDGAEIFDAVKQAMGEFQLQKYAAPSPGLEKEDILEAVREGWENYKPEIELQNFGLERDEILQCLREGLEEYRSLSDARGREVLSKEEVLTAIKNGLENFTPPLPVPIVNEPHITKEEVFEAVRECLESFDFAAVTAPPSNTVDISRDDILDAVREGLDNFELPANAVGLPRDIELTKGDVYEVMRECLHNSPASSGVFGPEILGRLQDIVERMGSEFKAVSEEAKQNVAANGRDTEQVLDALKDGLEHLRCDIELYVDRAADVTGRDEIIDTMKNGFERIKADIETSITENAQTAPDAEVLDGIKGEIQHLRETIATTLLRGGSSSDRDDIIEALRLGLDDLRSDMMRKDDRPESIFSTTGEILDALNDGVESLRNDILKATEKPSDAIVSTEALEAINRSLESLRNDIADVADRPVDAALSDEVIESLRDGLDSLRSEVAKLAARPVETTMSDEILDALKDGLADVRADIERMRKNESEERDLSPERGQLILADSLRRNDIENLEVLITQLRIKVEALDAEARASEPERQQPSTPAEGVVTKDDIVLLEQQMRELQDCFSSMANKERHESEDAVTKEDVEAIETLLRNTKAKIDDMTMPDPEMSAKKTDIEAVELLLRDTKDVVDDLATRVEAENATKEDLRAMELLLKEVGAAVTDLKEHPAIESADGERITKMDLDAIEGLCMDTKAQIDLMAARDAEEVITKEDMTVLTDLVKEQQHKAQEYAESTAKIVEEGKLDGAGLALGVSEIKTFLEGLKTEVEGRLVDTTESVQAIGKVLEGIEEAVTAHADLRVDVKEVMEILAREFERSHGLGEGLKLEQEQKYSEMLQKLDERFDEIMTKYDDAQIAAEEAQKEAEAKEADKDQVLAATKAVAEELKLSIDTLGMTITESADKMGQDSKTVFNRVDDVYTKADETHCEVKGGLEETRVNVERVLAAVGDLHRDTSEHQPKIISSVNNVLSIARQHFEYSQKLATETPPPPPPMIMDVPEKYDDAEVQAKLDKLISQVTSEEDKNRVHSKLDTLIEQKASEEDRSHVHSKLDSLLDHATSTGKSLEQIYLLDQIHQRVMSTAAEVTDYFAKQSKLIAEEQEDKAKEAAEVALVLERRLAQKERVEEEVTELTTEKMLLQDEVKTLRAEKDELATQKARLAAEVASLETARKIRHEELAMMEARAESLERRVLEGIIDHSRALLISRPVKDPKQMSLKRVSMNRTSKASSQDTAVASPQRSSTPSIPHNSLSLALKSRPPPIRMNANRGTTRSPATAGGRRILSLNQITGNGSRGKQAIPRSVHDVFSSSLNSGAGRLGNLKRSHSVKTGSGAGYLRKTSAGTHPPPSSRGRVFSDMTSSIVEDKENSVFTEEDEEDGTEGEEEDDGRTVTETAYLSDGRDDDDDDDYGDESVTDDRSRSSLDRRSGGGTARTSMATSNASTAMLSAEEGSVGDEEGGHSEDDDDYSEAPTGSVMDEAATAAAQDAKSGMVLYDGNADSGVGEEIPTADLEGRFVYD